VRGWWWWWWVSKMSTTIDRFYEEGGRSRVCFMLRRYSQTYDLSAFILFPTWQNMLQRKVGSWS
jgi:hypothetical protein